MRKHVWLSLLLLLPPQSSYPFLLLTASCPLVTSCLPLFIASVWAYMLIQVLCLTYLYSRNRHATQVTPMYSPGLAVEWSNARIERTFGAFSLLQQRPAETCNLVLLSTPRVLTWYLSFFESSSLILTSISWDT